MRGSATVISQGRLHLNIWMDWAVAKQLLYASAYDIVAVTQTHFPNITAVVHTIALSDATGSQIITYDILYSETR